jgi:hypothetical protein
MGCQHMGISNFDQILLPPKQADPILLLDEVLSIPYRLGTSWSMNDGFDLHALVSTPAENLFLLFFLYFPRYRPPFGECCV